MKLTESDEKMVQQIAEKYDGELGGAYYGELSGRLDIEGRPILEAAIREAILRARGSSVGEQEEKP